MPPFRIRAPAAKSRRLKSLERRWTMHKKPNKPRDPKALINDKVQALLKEIQDKSLEFFKGLSDEEMDEIKRCLTRAVEVEFFGPKVERESAKGGKAKQTQKLDPHTERCLKDIIEYAEDPWYCLLKGGEHPLSALFTKTKVSLFGDEEKRKLERSLPRLANQKPKEPLIEELQKGKWMLDYIWPTLETVRLLDVMAEKMPNMEEAIRFMRTAVITRLSGGDEPAPLAERNLLLTGPGGTGKTLFAEMLATALGVPMLRLAFGNMDAGFSVAGLHAGWANGQPGSILKHLLGHKVINPIILLDEIDKAFQRGNENSPVGQVLYELLDRRQASSFKDNFLDVPMRADLIYFIATANDLSVIPQALQTRCKIIEVREPTDEELRQVIPDLIRVKAREKDGWVECDISPEIVDRILRATRERNFRALTGIIDEAMANAMNRAYSRIAQRTRILGRELSTLAQAASKGLSLEEFRGQISNLINYKPRKKKVKLLPDDVPCPETEEEGRSFGFLK
ncbi:AAA family ATPase [Candidatus Parcubacteria bacterium]|nr:MAG: AAA family ATPase [Candidatus Parcubacteria bacterium]